MYSSCSSSLNILASKVNKQRVDDIGRNMRAFIGSFSLEKAFKIIKFNDEPSTARFTAKPRCPSAPDMMM